jgi:hypothetical protein
MIGKIIKEIGEEIKKIITQKEKILMKREAISKRKNGQGNLIVQYSKSLVINKSIVEGLQETKAKSTLKISKKDNLNHMSKKEMKKHTK